MPKTEDAQPAVAAVFGARQPSELRRRSIVVATKPQAQPQPARSHDEVLHLPLLQAPIPNTNSTSVSLRRDLEGPNHEPTVQIGSHNPNLQQDHIEASMKSPPPPSLSST